MMIKESGVNMDNQLYNQIKAVHEQYIKEQNRLEDEIDRLRREIVCLDNEVEIEALNKLVRIDDIKRKMVVEFIHSLDKIVEQ
ncbi:hypothetical protein [uncultured Holdemanella sp.]|uniref:hypothetical protein n=1 Tax=uncultured Holdemanella sp. TaxID=1763549 RepID=UPI002600ACD4|nr:hypothetical protein [uncultured Holdemanella sp.]